VTDNDLRPTHLDWHCLTGIAWPTGHGEIFDLTVALATGYGLAVRAWLDPGRGKLRQRGLPVVDNPFLDSFAVSLDGKAARYATLLRDLPSGLNEWAVHPGLGSQQARMTDPYGWRVRQPDCEFLTWPRAREILRQEGIAVIDYRLIQHAWSQNSAPWQKAKSPLLSPR
jgi:chitin disaccharide deacetylase